MPVKIRITLTAALLCASIAGCGAVFDTAYTLTDGKFSESETDNRPTEHTENSIEYEVGADLALQCFARTRRIERTATISKTFEYRGGFEKSTYAGAAVADGLIGALVAGTMLGICTSEESDVSCLNMTWASPFAIDLVYSLIRHKTVRPPVLVGKTRSSDSLVHGATPIDEQQTDCSSVASLWLGTATGPSRVERLNSGGEEQRLREGAIAVALVSAPAGSTAPTEPALVQAHLSLSPEVAQAWASQNDLALWVQNGQGTISRVLVDRCTVLRPLAHSFVGEVRTTFDQNCPLPAPSGGQR